MKKLLITVAVASCFSGSVLAQPKYAGSWTNTERAEVTKCAQDVAAEFKSTQNEFNAAIAAKKLSTQDKPNYSKAYKEALDKWGSNDWDKPYKTALQQCNDQRSIPKALRAHLNAMIEINSTASTSADQQLKDCRTAVSVNREYLQKNYKEWVEHLNTRPKTQQKFIETFKVSAAPTLPIEANLIECRQKLKETDQLKVTMLSNMRNGLDLDK